MKTLSFLIVIFFLFTGCKEKNIPVIQPVVKPETIIVKVPETTVPLMRATYITSVIYPETYNLGADTFTIVKSDKVISVTIEVPTGATDSVWIMGIINTLHGHSTSPVFIEPGNNLSIFDNDETRIDSLTIMVTDTAKLYQIRAKQ